MRQRAGWRSWFVAICDLQCYRIQPINTAQLHVILYVAIVSGIVDAFAMASGGASWSEFWGSLSPYTVLYTTGRCLARLAQGGAVVHGIIFVYIVLRSLSARAAAR